MLEEIKNDNITNYMLISKVMTWATRYYTIIWIIYLRILSAETVLHTKM